MKKNNYTEIKKYFSQFPLLKFPKGKIIIKPGQKFENIYFIKSGYARAYTVTPKGESTINCFKPLFSMSMIHFYSQQKNNYYFQAITPLEVYILSFSEYKKLITQDENTNQKITEFFFNCLLNYFANQTNITNGTALNKIASVLLQLSHDHGDIKKGKFVVNFPTTHRILANLVGLTRETTSVQMSSLQKQGIISTKRTQFVINDLKKLKAIAQTTD